MLVAGALAVGPAGCASGEVVALGEDDGGASSGVGGSSSGCGGVELCDGVDNDCDGDIDEGCACVAGEQRSCYNGAPELEGIGACQPGSQVCDANGNWGPCEGEGAPGEEVCDGVDNDCDERVDEDQGSITCGLGTCQVTVDACDAGAPVACIPGQPSAAEICDGFDDNCDGQIDEGCSCTDGDTQSCYSGSMDTFGVGSCQGGTQLCSGGGWGPCAGEVLPSSEVCDGANNDCDADGIDEDDPGGGAQCDTGSSGICGAGHQHCVEGSIGCVQDVPALDHEICNGLDDDCNGSKDDNPQGEGDSCDTGAFGICAAGTQQCVNDALECMQNEQAKPAEICNGLDDDCDDAADEGNPGGGGPCDTGLKGICADGIEFCGPEGDLVCEVQTQPGTVLETCNNKDDDCDGVKDDDPIDVGMVCNTGQNGICATGIVACTNNAPQCVPDQQPAPNEICYNGLDDDCNGKADVQDGCCDHDICDSGGPMTAGCSSCVTDVCNYDDYCCTDAWDELCQQLVYYVCGSTECGTCSNPRVPSTDCGAGHHCQPLSDGTGLCLDPTGAGVQYSTCAKDSDCAVPYTCVNVGQNNYCLEWCSSDGHCNMAAGDSCVGFDPPIGAGGQEYGVCYDGLG
jgi:hypothetical protein